MSKLIIIVGKNGFDPSHMRGEKKIVSEEKLNLEKLMKDGRFFSKCWGYISTLEKVKETLEHGGWVIFAKKK